MTYKAPQFRTISSVASQLIQIKAPVGDDGGTSGLTKNKVATALESK